MAHRLWVLFVAVILTVSLRADEDTVRSGVLLTKKSAVLKSGPNKGRTMAKVPKGTKLQWLEGQEKNNWLRVVTRGGEGWVAKKKVSIVMQPPPAPVNEQAELAAAACAANLDACPVTGCESAGTPHAFLNQAKRTVATGTPVTVAFSDLQALQTATDAVVTQGQDIPDRAVIQNLTAGSATLGEGMMVQVAAFLSPDKPGPHPNTGESVNCNLRTAANNDFHIPVTETAGQSPYLGIVVEMIPQDRNAAWTIPSLKTLQTNQTQVKVVGQLFYDNAHVVNGDPDNPINGQPERFTLWEIHPISQFLVCSNGTGCDVNSDSGWTALENVQ